MSASPSTAFDDATGVESSGRWPLLFLFAMGIAWLVTATALGLLASVQAHSSDVLADCPVLTIGRCRALAESAFLYGWVVDAGLAVVLWILARLAEEPLRTNRWIVAGGLFWNLGVAIGLAGIATGDATALPWLELPRYVQPLLVVSYAAVALGGVLAWTGRRRRTLFAAQWYGVAALFLAPWLLCASQVTLLWFPLHGVARAVAAGWCAQGVWTYWLAPLALAAAYYLVPKLTGRVLPGYELAPVGFWCLLFVGGWAGGRHLIGGPVPAWIGSVAVVTSAWLLFHYLVVVINLRPVFGAPGVAARFVAAGVAAYALGGLADSVTSFRGVAALTQFTYVDEAERQLALVGAASLILLGAVYYAVPRLAGRPWCSPALRRAHLALALLGTALIVGGLAAAGLAQGSGLADARTAFSAIAAAARPGLLAAEAGQALFLLGALLLAVNFIGTVACALRAELTAAGEPVAASAP